MSLDEKEHFIRDIRDDLNAMVAKGFIKTSDQWSAYDDCINALFRLQQAFGWEIENNKENNDGQEMRSLRKRASIRPQCEPLQKSHESTVEAQYPKKDGIVPGQKATHAYLYTLRANACENPLTPVFTHCTSVGRTDLPEVGFFLPNLNIKHCWV